jgi:hypothetical protein
VLVQGLFRLPGNTDNIKTLQLLVNKGEFSAMMTRPGITVHDVASLLKVRAHDIAACGV